MSPEQNKALVHRFIEQVFTKGNIVLADELLAADFRDHTAPPGIAPGLEGAKQVFAAFRTAFPDLEASIGGLVAEDDKAAIYGTFRGTHRGAFFGIPATGKQMEMHWIDVYRITGGKIVEVWHVEDFLGMLQQLGVGTPLAQPEP